MAWVALNCPQCSAPLPRVAIWRAVKCSSCGALINRTESVVMRDTFRQALVRAHGFSEGSSFAERLHCGGQDYGLIKLLGNGEISQVYLAQRIGSLPYLATIKLSSSSEAAARYAHEAIVLRELATQSVGANACGYQSLPEVVAQGRVEGHHFQHALVLRYPDGCWGNLAELNDRFALGLDPRHVIWIWRRMLKVLSHVHSRGWSHGEVRPDNALIHPRDHGVQLIGWAFAQKDASANDQANDVLHSARIIQVLLSGTGTEGAIPDHVPAGLAELVTQASQDKKYCRTHCADGIDLLLREAAKRAYGPPSFVPLIV